MSIGYIDACVWGMAWLRSTSLRHSSVDAVEIPACQGFYVLLPRQLRLRRPLQLPQLR